MIVRRLALVLLVVWIGLSSSGAGYAPTPRIFLATVERVSAGDILVVVAVNGTRVRLRLLGIDAPKVAQGSKPGQPFGEDSRKYLDHLIGGKTVRVDVYGPDQNDHSGAILWHGEVNVNVLMVAMGYAEVNRAVPCQVYCRDLKLAERKARRDRLGMWVQGDRYESPVKFRRRLQAQGE
jgi:micrococcal nuclease